MENKSEILNDSCMDLVAVDTTSSVRPPQHTNKMVDFCCAANLPGDFVLATIKDPKILYDLRNLSCKIEPKCSSRPGSTCSCASFDIIVVGSIPFIVNSTVDSEDLCSTTDRTCPIKISCGCVVPVEKTVCNVCSYEAAIKACALLELKLTKCDCVTPMDVKPIQNSCAVIFTGKFKFPDCM